MNVLYAVGDTVLWLCLACIALGIGIGVSIRREK